MNPRIKQSPLLTVMFGAVKKAARQLVRDFGEVEHLQVSRKGPGDFVSTADHRAEKALYEELSKARPGFGFLMEEGGEVPGKDPDSCWIIDPLDGTNNFLHGIPHFAISVALKQKGDIVAGMTFNPISDELFFAEKGRGAFLNDRRLRVSSRTELMDSLVAMGIPKSPDDRRKVALEKMNELGRKVSGIRRFGATTLDLAYVAAGRYEAYWDFHTAAWDIAVGIILVREAGGFVTDITGTLNIFENKTILATNAGTYDPLLTVLK